MLKKIILLFAITNLAAVPVFSAQNTLLFENSKPMHIFVNNRIVASVNGKAISVIDVMKKMDLLFYRKFPQYASFVEARFQFYQINWRHILKEIIEKELIIADAEESKVPITNGDVRQEMENLFGPNIISNLDKAGLTFDEAWAMVKEELIIRKMVSFRINSKAIKAVVPQDIRVAYEEFVRENRIPDKWRYRVITIRGEDSSECAETANAVWHCLIGGNASVENLQEKAREQSLAREKTSINLSEDYIHSDKEVSDSYKEILTNLKPDTYSKAIAQKSKTNQSIVFRILYLKELVQGSVPSFSIMEQKLKNKLTDQAVEKEADEYMKKLRNHFNVKEEDQAPLVPEDFQPFSLN
ncbi:MAG TPA: peptidyl-prolyl cis-trans isomerase [Waddliaceae bacterium]